MDNGESSYRRFLLGDKEAMSRLKSEYRQVLWLMFSEGLSTGEAARIMGKSKKQIGNLVYRAKKALRAELEKEGFCYEEL